MHGRSDIVTREALFVEGFAGDRRAAGQHQRDTAFDPHELPEPLAQFSVRAQLEEQGRRQLPVVGNEIVVGGDLVRDLFVAQHAFGARHLHDLPAHRLGVLEHDRHELTERDPAPALQGDDRPAELLARVRRPRPSRMSSTVSFRIASLLEGEHDGPGYFPGPRG